MVASISKIATFPTEAKIVYKAYELVEKNLTQNNGREYIPESIVKEGTIVKLEVLIKP